LVEIDAGEGHEASFWPLGPGDKKIANTDFSWHDRFSDCRVILTSPRPPLLNRKNFLSPQIRS
jgi:hypothetical protein